MKKDFLLIAGLALAGIGAYMWSRKPIPGGTKAAGPVRTTGSAGLNPLSWIPGFLNQSPPPNISLNTGGGVSKTPPVTGNVSATGDISGIFSAALNLAQKLYGDIRGRGDKSPPSGKDSGAWYPEISAAEYERRIQKQAADILISGQTGSPSVVANVPIPNSVPVVSPSWVDTGTDYGSGSLDWINELDSDFGMDRELFDSGYSDTWGGENLAWV